MTKQATATFTITFEYDAGNPDFIVQDIAEAITDLGSLHDGYDEDFAIVKAEVR